MIDAREERKDGACGAEEGTEANESATLLLMAMQQTTEGSS